MKHSKRHDNPRHTISEPQPVRFEFFDPDATMVAIAGTFNEWQPDAKPMHPLGGGHWLKETVLSPGTYEYCLVVDGHWRPDPTAGESVPNPYGGRNSILKVASTPAAAHLAAAENAPLKNTGQPEKKKPMNRKLKAVGRDLGRFSEDARELLAATADMAGDKIVEARKRLAQSLDDGRGLVSRARVRTAKGVRAADATLHEHPYPVVVIAISVGVLIGYLLPRRNGH